MDDRFCDRVDRGIPHAKPPISSDPGEGKTGARLLLSHPAVDHIAGKFGEFVSSASPLGNLFIQSIVGWGQENRAGALQINTGGRQVQILLDNGDDGDPASTGPQGLVGEAMHAMGSAGISIATVEGFMRHTSDKLKVRDWGIPDVP
ncbi:hypothetical protein N7532_005857 [Penicillium argentinense]|uniref:Uncharacterized protein n=1 Tax=Penicillium argentinense TaxID=1131581 RepID=A0A9W9FET2_9EURO|nr:uncharacterized protein N7532_005857 [Penicillium argentinense]KAJ5098856.1 hypothetical protein N7532_005857 [Penicillium argentinense]